METMTNGRRAMAAFFNCGEDEVVFGQNMTSLTFALSRALARTWQEGDAIVLTSLDHDANFTPWVRAAADADVEVRVADFDAATGLLDPKSVIDLIDDKVRLVAVCLASNAIGTIVDVAAISEAAHSIGALVYVDSVHFAPHGLIDVQALNCDFLASSSYKYFGPHTGVLYGKYEHLDALTAYKVRPAPDGPPGKWMTGTQNHEGIAGTRAAVDYLADLGRSVADIASEDRRTALKAAFDAIRAYETDLAQQLLAGLAEIPQIRVWGITDPARIAERLPTVSITHDHVSPSQLAAALGGQ